MKIITTLFFAMLLFSFFSCEKENNETLIVEQTSCQDSEKQDHGEASICTTDLCNQYFPIWKELLQEKNNLSQAFYDTHLTIHRVETNTWNNGISFRVCYEFKVDWAAAYNCDHFIIKIEANNTLFSHLDLPRDTYLTKDEIAIALEGRAFSSDITKMTNSEELVSSSLTNAMNELIESSGVNILCLRRVILDSGSGNLTLKTFAKYIDEQNSCIFGRYDLITGGKMFYEQPCYI